MAGQHMRKQRRSALSLTLLALVSVIMASFLHQTAFVGSGVRSSTPAMSIIARPSSGDGKTLLPPQDWLNKEKIDDRWEAAAKAPKVAGDIPKHKLGLETSATELMKAAFRGDVAYMNIILKEDSSEELINAQDEFGWTALRYAIRARKVPAAKMLAVDYKADVNIASKSGCTPLMSAARNGLEEMVKGLVNIGADIAAVDNEGLTAFDYARGDAVKAMVNLSPSEAKEEPKETREKPTLLNDMSARWEAQAKAPLVSADIPKHKLGLETSATPLMKAAWEGDTQILYSLLTGTRGEEVVEDINAQDEYGWTAIRYAVRNQQAAAARMLAVDFKADINLPSKSGRTPLMSAAGNNLEEMVKGLVNCGADLTAVDNEGLSAFDLAQSDAIKAMTDPATAKEPEAEKEPAQSWEEVTETVAS